jgi:hypothetical protein
MISAPLDQSRPSAWSTPVRDTHIDIDLDPTRTQRQLLKRHVGLSRTTSNYCFHVVVTESLEHAQERRNLSDDTPYGIKELTAWTAEELYAEWREWQPVDYPWAADLSPQVAYEACRYASGRLADYCWHGADYPRPLTRRRRGEFRYSDGCYPTHPDALYLDGIGTVATAWSLGAASTAKVKGATVRERGRGWQVRLRVEAA